MSVDEILKCVVFLFLMSPEVICSIIEVCEEHTLVISAPIQISQKRSIEGRGTLSSLCIERVSILIQRTLPFSSD